MRLALVPLKMDGGDSKATFHNLARWVDQLHGKVDLIGFPNVEFENADWHTARGEAPVLHLAAESLAWLSAKYGVCITLGIWQVQGDHVLSMLMAADRTGQVESCSRLVGEDIIPPLQVLSFRMDRLRLALALPDDLERDAFTNRLKKMHPDLLFLPLFMLGENEKDAPEDLTSLFDKMSGLSRKVGCHFMAVNGLPLAKDSPRLCGGAVIYDAQGRFSAGKDCWKTEPLGYEMLYREDKKDANGIG